MHETPLDSPVSQSTRANISETCRDESGRWSEFVADAKSEVGDVSERKGVNGGSIVCHCVVPWPIPSITSFCLRLLKFVK